MEDYYDEGLIVNFPICLILPVRIYCLFR